MPKAQPSFTQKERKRLQGLYRHAPFGLLLTSHKDRPAPVLVVKERQEIDGERQGPFRDREQEFYGDPMRRVLSEGLLARMVESVTDRDEVSLDLNLLLVPRSVDKIELPLQVPLDDESGYKLGLLFCLSSKIRDNDRVELMARRIDRFSMEEAGYWYSRITRMDRDLQAFAIKGLKIVLCGDGGKDDQERVVRALEKLRRQ